MKFVITTLLSLSVTFLIAQNVLLEPGDLTTDVNGHTIEVVGTSSSSDMEIDLYLVNTASGSVTLTCTRTEVDGLAGTTNATCWNVCPPYINTGDEPVYIANIGGTPLTETASAGDTIKTFVGHYRPVSLEGCSLFKYEWKDKLSGITVASVFVRFIHQSTGTCTADIDDLSKIELSLYPNPAINNVTLKLGDLNNSMTYEVSNLLGQRKLKGSLLNEITNINTSELTEGIYFVTVRGNGKLIRTEKLVVKH